MSDDNQCTCACKGCRYFHLGSALADSRDTRHTQLLLALDLSIAAVCRRHGIPACTGYGDDEPCDTGMLHSRTAHLAQVLSRVIENPSLAKRLDIGGAIAALLAELQALIGDNPRLS